MEDNITLSKADYADFKAWQAQVNRAPKEGEYRFYNRLHNPFMAEHRNASAQNELYAKNPALGLSLAREAGDIGMIRLFEAHIARTPQKA